MTYTPTEWKNGDIITAEKLNKLENGVAQDGDGGALKINVDESSGTPTLDASYNDIVTAAEAGKIVFIKTPLDNNIGGSLLYFCYWADLGTSYTVGFCNIEQGRTFYFISNTINEPLTLAPEQQGS